MKKKYPIRSQIKKNIKKVHLYFVLCLFISNFAKCIEVRLHLRLRISSQCTYLHNLCNNIQN